MIVVHATCYVFCIKYIRNICYLPRMLEYVEKGSVTSYIRVIVVKMDSIHLRTRIDRVQARIKF